MLGTMHTIIWAIFFILNVSSNAFADSQTQRLVLQESQLRAKAFAHPGTIEIPIETKAIKGMIVPTEQGLQGLIHIDLKSIHTGIELRDHHLQEVLNTMKNPIASISFHWLGFKPHRIKKQIVRDSSLILKLNGISQEVPIQVTIDRAENGFEFEGSTHIQLSDFHLKPPEFMGASVDNKVEVYLNGLCILGSEIPRK